MAARPELALEGIENTLSELLGDGEGIRGRIGGHGSGLEGDFVVVVVSCLLALSPTSDRLRGRECRSRWSRAGATLEIRGVLELDCPISIATAGPIAVLKSEKLDDILLEVIVIVTGLAE